MEGTFLFFKAYQGTGTKVFQSEAPKSDPGQAGALPEKIITIPHDIFFQSRPYQVYLVYFNCS